MEGQRIKDIRKQRGYTLADLAKKTGYTASFLSQIERNNKIPSLEALRKIAKCLETTIATIIVDYDDSFLIKKEKRKKTIIPDINTVYEFITPTVSNQNIKPNMIGIYIELEPNSKTSEKPISHASQESIFVVEGEIEIKIVNKTYILEKGDSFYITDNIEHNIINSSDSKAAIIAYSSPPNY